MAILDQMIAAVRISQNATDNIDEAFTALLGVNRTDGRCLDIIQRLGRITAGELAHHTGLTTGAVTVVIDRLERAGYVARSRDPSDRRKVLVELTDRTNQVAALVYSEVGALGKAGMAAMSIADMTLVTRFLRTGAFMNQALARLLRDTCQSVPAGADPLDIARDFSASVSRTAPQLERMMGEIWRSAPDVPNDDLTDIV